MLLKRCASKHRREIDLYIDILVRWGNDSITSRNKTQKKGLPFSMLPYLPKASPRESSLVSKLSPPTNSLPSSDMLALQRTGVQTTTSENVGRIKSNEMFGEADHSLKKQRRCATKRMSSSFFFVCSFISLSSSSSSLILVAGDNCFSDLILPLPECGI